MENAIKKIITLNVDQHLYDAALEYLDLQLRKTHPEGKSDNARRFYIAHQCSCCRVIRAPSREYPFSQMLHARTAVHVAHKNGMPNQEKAIRSLSRIFKKHPDLAQSYELLLIRIARFTAQQVIDKI